jgi:hypothetical protein
MAKKVQVGSGSGSVINWPLDLVSDPYLSQDYGSADPDPREIFRDPQHCFQPYVQFYVKNSKPRPAQHNRLYIVNPKCFQSSSDHRLVSELSSQRFLDPAFYLSAYLDPDADIRLKIEF